MLGMSAQKITKTCDFSDREPYRPYELTQYLADLPLFQSRMTPKEYACAHASVRIFLVIHCRKGLIGHASNFAVQGLRSLLIPRRR